MFNIFLYLTLLFALLEWIAVQCSWRRLEYIAKPGTMIFLLIWLQYTAGSGAFFHSNLGWFALGACLSLAGDVVLLISDRLFVAGLAAFLLAHLAYIVGFTLPLPVFRFSMLALAGVVILVSWKMYRYFNSGIKARSALLQRAILLYSIVITGMLLSALITILRADWSLNPALLVSLGASLFYLSDFLLARITFGAPLRYGRLMVMATYHLGQLLLLIGALVQSGYSK
jgi:uncharacterized membrane protein YhhN